MEQVDWDEIFIPNWDLLNNFIYDKPGFVKASVKTAIAIRFCQKMF